MSEEAPTEAELSADTQVIPNAFELDPHDSPTRSAELPQQSAFDAFDDDWDGEDASSSDFTVESASSELSSPLAGAEPMSAEVRPARGPIDDTELLELSATTVAADLDMDWDEDEVLTTYQGRPAGLPESAAPEWSAPPALPQVLPPAPSSPPSLAALPRLPSVPAPAGSAPPPAVASGIPSPFPPPRTSAAPSYPGMPSPFSGPPVASAVPRPSASSSFPPAPPRETGDHFLVEGGFEEEATRVMASLPPPAVETLVDEEWPEERANRRGVVAGLAVAAALLVAFGAYSWLQPGGSATVTVVTQPVDAEVRVDGRPLTGQTSPFTLQGLAPDVTHEIEISRKGYAAQTSEFTVAAGEVKALSEVHLAPDPVHTGFALDSVPAGARVFVDGEAVEGATPVRLMDLSAGLHRIRLEHDGYEPWQTQIALVDGQMIDLPAAALATASAVPGGAAPAMAAAAERARPSRASAPREKPQPRAKQRSSSKRSRATASRSTRRSKPRFASKAAPARSAPSSGGQGTLRINSRPWSAIYVDGRFLGNTPQLNLPLSAGRHKIRLVNKQMGMTKNLRVNIKAGSTTTKVVNLLN